MTTRRLGAIHTPAPAAIQPLGQRAALSRMMPPPRADWSSKCPPDGDALGNNTHGDCVEAAMLRVIECRRANVWGDAWKPDTPLALGLYATLTGFNPATGLPDDGTDTAASMAYWARTGVLANITRDVSLWATVNPLDNTGISLAIAHAGPVLATIALPLAAQDLAAWGQAPGAQGTWAPGSWGYHRVMVAAYDGQFRTVRTWGEDVQTHPDFWARYVVAVDVAISRGWLTTTGLTLAGMDWDALEADVALVN